MKAILLKTTLVPIIYMGDNLRLALKMKNIFIAEIVKNRDGEDDEEHNIMRYEADLGYNIFEPLK